MDYFTLFNLPISYYINTQELISRFLDLQRRYHPDKFINKTQKEQLAAVSYSATINQAWQTLRDPISRAEYFLSLHGFNLKREQYIESNTPFLIEQLKFREELDKIEQSKNNILLESFIKKIESIFNDYYQQIVEQLHSKMWNAAVDTLQKLRFLDKLRNSAEQLKERMLNF